MARQSTKREYSLWHNKKRRWWRAGNTYRHNDLPYDFYSKFHIPYRFEGQSEIKAPFFVSYTDALKWMADLDENNAKVSIQQRGTYQEVRARVAKQRSQTKTLGSYGIWMKDENDWLDMRLEGHLPIDLQLKYGVAEIKHTVFMSSEDILIWYQDLTEGYYDEEDIAIQPKSRPKKEIIQALEKEDSRRQYALQYL